MSLKSLEILLTLHDTKGSLKTGLDLYKKLEKATKVNMRKPTAKDVKALPDSKDLRRLIQNLKSREQHLKAVANMKLPPEAQPARNMLIRLDNDFQSAAGSTDVEDEKGCQKVASAYKALKAELDREIGRLEKKLTPFEEALGQYPQQRRFYARYEKYAREASKAFLDLAKKWPELTGTGGKATLVGAYSEADKAMKALSVHVKAYDGVVANVKKLYGELNGHFRELAGWLDETKKHPDALKFRNVAALRKLFQ